MIKPLYIFDLDGTLALIDHRLHFIEHKDDPNRWNKFYQACDKDKPNIPVIDILNQLRLSSDVWVWSGRSDLVKAKTIDWLAEHTSFLSHEIPEVLKMRDREDYTHDDKLKKSWLDDLIQHDRYRIKAVFEDRSRVVNMWRDNGIACLQVANGEF